MNRDLLYKKAVEKWGMESQMNLLQKHCADLISEISKGRMSRSSTKNLVKELANVQNMLDQVIDMYSLKNVVAEERERIDKHIEKCLEEVNE